MKNVKLFYNIFLIMFLSFIIETGCAQADRDNPEDYVLNGYTLQYVSNGADGGNIPSFATAYRKNKTVTVEGNIGNLTKTGYLFAYWTTSKDGSGKCYMEGDTFTINSNLTLYAQWGTSDGLTYNQVGNTYSVSGQPPLGGIVVIPSRNNNLPVTAIEYGAFNGCIGAASIIIPSSITSIGIKAFWNCIGLSNIKVAGSNSSFTSIDGVLFNKDKGNLIYYPAGKTDYIYTIPESVTSISSDAFFSRNNLSEFMVEGTNNSFTIIDGVLLSKDTKKIICYPPGKSGSSYYVPSGVVTIGDYSFGYIIGLSEIIITEGVTAIGTEAFAYSLITDITIPVSVRTISDYAFYSCQQLKITMVAIIPPALGSYIFSSSGIYSSNRIKVPNSVLSVYKNHPDWNAYSSNIEGY